jgi:Xaa-Pro aminopeptidase
MSDILQMRLEALRRRAAEAGAEALLVTAPADVRYLSNFSTPKDGRVLVTAEDALLITDDRYTAQAAEEVAINVRIVGGYAQLEAVRDLIGDSPLAVQAEHLPWSTVRTLETMLGHTPIATQSITRELRLIKSESEIERLRAAAALTDAAFEHIVAGVLRSGVREVEVALELERFIRSQGGEGMAFDVIVASGHRSAMPHGVASERVVERGDLVTLDFGARVDGYHADMTRAVAIGPVAEPLRSWFDAVLEAQERAVAAIRPGLSGIDADRIARSALAAAGLDTLFVHSLGHGVGLEIHEGPSLSMRSTDILQPNMLVTIEPGVYQPGVGGLRIEDLLLVTEGGFERLSHSPKGYLEL